MQPSSRRLTGSFPPLPVLAWFELSREFVGRTPEVPCSSVTAEGAGSRAEGAYRTNGCLGGARWRTSPWTSSSGSAGLRRRGGERPFLFSGFRAHGLAGSGRRRERPRRDAEGRLLPPPASAALLIGPAAAAAAGPAARPPSGWRRRRSGGLRRLAGPLPAAGPGRRAGGSGPGSGAAAQGRRSPRRGSSPGSLALGPAAPFSVRPESGLKFSGEVTCSTLPICYCRS